MLSTEGIVWIVTGILGVIAGILSALYAYVYHTQIKPGCRHKHEKLYTLDAPVVSHGSTANATETDDNRRKSLHPFIIFAYAAKMNTKARDDVIHV